MPIGLFEVADGEMSAMRSMVAQEMTAAYPLDPPLEVDAGSGATWLDAK